MRINKHLSKLHSPKSLLVIATLAMIGIVLYFTQWYWSEEDIAQFIAQFGPLSMLVYVVVVTIFNVAAPLSASPIMLLGFSLFQQWAIWLFALGNFIAMAINFWLARRYGRSLIRRIVGQDSMNKVDEVAQSYGLTALFIFRLFLSGINDITSYAFGLTPVSFKSYMLISIIASIPSFSLFVIISRDYSNSIQLMLLQLAIGSVLMVVYVVGRYVIQRFLRLLLKGY